MHLVYNLAINVLQSVLPLSKRFSHKMGLFVNGRKKVFAQLQEKLAKGKPVIWFHAASLGEYEQGVPVMEEMKEQFPEHQLVITFFSPSGYEVKKNNAFAKATVYLPLDTPSNARRFLDIVKPEITFFIKYEFWPNYLKELKKRNHRIFLLSGIFKEEQIFFKGYGKWMIRYLEAFEYFFVQDKSSAQVLNQLGFSNHKLTGDTRFDRVSKQIEMDNTLAFVADFKGDSLCVVCGSTWPECNNAITSFINNHIGVAKFIIAPHEIRADKITTLKRHIKVKTMLYSEKEGKDVKNYDVLILDTIGLLTKVYSYADVAYVGGAMGMTGLHNILEPATFGMPILTGTHIDTFTEAKRLQQLAGLYTVTDAAEFEEVLSKLLTDANFRKQTAMIAGHYVNSNTGATQSVMEYLEEHP